jgi:hypothetical protein
MGVLRDGPDDLGLRLPCIIKLLRLCTVPIGPGDPPVYIYIAHLCLSVIHQPCHLADSVVPDCFSFWINILLLLLLLF